MNRAPSRKTAPALAALAWALAAAAAAAQEVVLPPLSAPLAPAPERAPELPPRRAGPVPFSAGPPPAPGTPVGVSGDTPLSLAEVLIAVDRHYPLVRAAEQERVVAAGRQLSAQGAFDINFRFWDYWIDGTYDSHRFGFQLDQPSPYLGASFFAGYRLGAGDYPVYYGERKTAEGGEFRAGAMLPLLRNRDIDRARAQVAKASIDRQIAEPAIQLQRIDITRAATQTYWRWLAAGQRLAVTQEVLRVARQRDVDLGKRVRAGTLAQVEQDDNRRAILEREARLVAAQRAYQQAAISLSLYSRDDAGAPVVPGPDRLPPFVEPPASPDPARRQEDLELALRQRPEIQRLALQRQRTQVDLRLAENLLLPAVNVALSGYQDVGFGRRSPQSTSRLDRESLEAAVLVDVPLQRRDARGRVLEAKAELARLAAQEQMARDRVQAEVQDALNALDRAFELRQRARDNARLARFLQDAERRQFEVGRSDLFRVNIRELTAAEARFLEVDALAEYYRALAEYLAALGLDPTQPPPCPPLTPR